MTNTKARHQEIYAAAVEVLGIFGGVETIDAFPQDERARILKKMADNVVSRTDCTRGPARSNVAKAMRRARFDLMQQADPDRWGGARPNTGPPRMPEGEKRQQVSTRLAPGSKELAQAIAKVLELPGWGRAVDQALVAMVEGDRELKSKLAEMGIIIKGNNGVRL